MNKCPGQSGTWDATGQLRASPLCDLPLEIQGSLPVKVPDAVALQLFSGERMGRPEVAQQACAAHPRDLPDPEEAQDVVNPVSMEVPARAHSACAHQLRFADAMSCFVRTRTTEHFPWRKTRACPAA